MREEEKENELVIPILNEFFLSSIRFSPLKYSIDNTEINTYIPPYMVTRYWS